MRLPASSTVIVAERDEVDHKLSCPQCSARWSDLNSFKKHVREICPPTWSILKGTATPIKPQLRPPRSSLPHSSPLSSAPSSTPPATPDDDLKRFSRETFWTFSDDATSIRRRLASSPPLRKPKGTAPRRYRLEPVVETIIYPPSVGPPPPRPSRLRPTESPSPRFHQPPLPKPEATPLLTSARSKRKRLARAVDSVWAPIERKGGHTLSAVYDEHETDEELEVDSKRHAGQPWWDVRYWKGEAGGR